jgi:hypothetical protein
MLSWERENMERYVISTGAVNSSRFSRSALFIRAPRSALPLSMAFIISGQPLSQT